MIKIDSNTKKTLMDLYTKKGIGLEGNITKLIDTEDDEDFKNYLKDCETKDGDKRKKRLDMTKKIQKQNEELVTLNEKNEKMMEDLQNKITEIEESKLTFEVQNRELNEWKKENLELTEKLQTEMMKSEKARVDAEAAKQNAENDLDLLQKKSQTELIGTIVKVALGVIMSVGVITTIMYMVSLFMDKDTQIIGSTWSNMFGILLTNAFSIIGTIMGVKYASEKKES